MRAVIRCVLALIGIAATVVGGPAGVGLAAANHSYTPAIASVLPTRGEVVGVAQPVVVTFSAPVANRHAAERAIEVTSAPAMTGKFEWLDNDVMQWVPDRYWPAHSTVALSVGGMSTDFNTGPAVVGVANISDHTFTVSIDGVERGTAAPDCRRRTTDPTGENQGVMPASMGRPEFPTPVGSYTVLSKERSVIMDSSSVGIPIDVPRVTCSRWITPSVHQRWPLRAFGSVGCQFTRVENVSHGCISLSPEDAEWYFNTVNIGDPVIVQE